VDPSIKTLRIDRRLGHSGAIANHT
jgi:hypothetical protein